MDTILCVYPLFHIGLIPLDVTQGLTISHHFKQFPTFCLVSAAPFEHYDKQSTHKTLSKLQYENSNKIDSTPQDPSDFLFVQTLAFYM